MKYFSFYADDWKTSGKKVQLRSFIDLNEAIEFGKSLFRKWKNHSAVEIIKILYLAETVVILKDDLDKVEYDISVELIKCAC